MAYFEITVNNVTHDYSSLTSALEIGVNHNYTSQTNAKGNTVVDYINKKREISVTIIHTDANHMAQLQADINAFNVKLSFLNPQTKTLETNVDCIIPSNNVSYYTIQQNRKEFNATNLKFVEL